MIPFQFSFAYGTFGIALGTNRISHCMKQALVLLISKRAYSRGLGDLRLINILPVYSKILDRVMEGQIREYMNHFDILFILVPISSIS